MNKNKFVVIFLFFVVASVFSVFGFAETAEKKAGITNFQEDFDAIEEKVKSMFLVEVYNDDDQLLGTGSGFVAFNEHYFITNHHVIEDAAYIWVYDDYGVSYKLTTVIAVDELNDIAILAFFAGGRYESLTLAPNTSLKRGQKIVAIGSPKGVKNTVSTGNISAFVEWDDDTSSIQFTAAISPGSSGGALFDNNGDVIGLIFSQHREGENMNYAVPIEKVIELYEIRNSTKPVSLSEYNATPTPKPTITPKLTPSPSPKPTATPKASIPITYSYYIYISGGCNIRTGPGTEYDIVGYAYDGSVYPHVKTVKSNDNKTWYAIYTSTGIYYVSASYGTMKIERSNAALVIKSPNGYGQWEKQGSYYEFKCQVTNQSVVKTVKSFTVSYYTVSKFGIASDVHTVTIKQNISP